MFKYVFGAMIALTLMASNSVGAEAEATHSFTLNVDYNTAVEWSQGDGPDRLAQKDGKVEVLEKKGDTVKLKARTPKGTFIYTVRESITYDKNTLYYTSKLVSCEQGGIEEQVVRVTMTRYGQGVKVDIYAQAKVNNPRVNSRQLRLELRMSMMKAQRILENEISNR
jgi:hypothetical protein